MLINCLCHIILQNDKLKEEQEVLIQNLLRQAKDADKLFNEEDIKEKDHVILAMKEMWDKQRERERRIEGMVNVRPPDKSVYWRTIFFVSHPKHLLWVLKRTVSMRLFF